MRPDSKLISMSPFEKKLTETWGHVLVFMKMSLYFFFRSVSHDHIFFFFYVGIAIVWVTCKCFQAVKIVTSGDKPFSVCLTQEPEDVARRPSTMRQACCADCVQRNLVRSHGGSGQSLNVSLRKLGLFIPHSVIKC